MIWVLFMLTNLRASSLSWIVAYLTISCLTNEAQTGLCKFQANLDFDASVVELIF